jgi:hypothetical protein
MTVVVGNRDFKKRVPRSCSGTCNLAKSNAFAHSNINSVHVPISIIEWNSIAESPCHCISHSDTYSIAASHSITGDNSVRFTVQHRIIVADANCDCIDDAGADWVTITDASANQFKKYNRYAKPRYH